MPVDPESPIPDRELQTEVIRLVAAVRRQTLAIWTLAALFFLVWGAPWIVWLWQMNRITTGAPAAVRAEPVATGLATFDNDFSHRTPDEQIRRATVILATQRKTEGGRHVQIVSRILKAAPGVELAYKPGDEYPPLSHAIRPECNDDCEGDGQIVFMTGRPPMETMSTSYRAGRVTEFGDRTLDDIARAAAKH